MDEDAGITDGEKGALGESDSTEIQEDQEDLFVAVMSTASRDILTRGQRKKVENGSQCGTRACHQALATPLGVDEDVENDQEMLEEENEIWALAADETFRDEKRRVPENLDKALLKLHQNLGHCSNAALSRMLRLGGASKKTQEYAKYLKCPVCERISRPTQHKVTKPTSPTSVNQSVGLDLTECKDIDGKRYNLLSIIDHATSFCQVRIIKDKSSSEVANVFYRDWVGWLGVPSSL